MSKGLEGLITNSAIPQAVEGTPKAKENEEGDKKKIAQLEAQLKELELKAAQLSVLEKETNLQDLQERLAERQLRRENIKQRSVINGATLKQLDANDKAVQNRCNHHKGGDGAHGVVGGQGQDSQYAVLKHTFANGDMWVRCLRCGKTWKPPLRNGLNAQGKPRYSTEADYIEAVIEYKTACQFQTRNSPSSSAQFRYSDGGQYYREVTDNASLR